MTLKDKVREVEPNIVKIFNDTIPGCPYMYKYLRGHYDEERRGDICHNNEALNAEKCNLCWDLEYVEDSDVEDSDVEDVKEVEEKKVMTLKDKVGEMEPENIADRYFGGVNENSDTSDVVEEVKEEKKEAVNHPSHYQGKNECIDVMVAMFGVEAVKHFCMCNAYKYRFRSNAKNGEEDIRKAEWYESKLIELNNSEMR